jgi:hypothetical protein
MIDYFYLDEKTNHQYPSEEIAAANDSQMRFKATKRNPSTNEDLGDDVLSSDKAMNYNAIKKRNLELLTMLNEFNLYKIDEPKLSNLILGARVEHRGIISSYVYYSNGIMASARVDIINLKFKEK